MTAKEQAMNYLIDRDYGYLVNEQATVEQLIEKLHGQAENMLQRLHDRKLYSEQTVNDVIDVYYNLGVAEGLLHKAYTNERWNEL